MDTRKETNDNLAIWDSVKTPPDWALKPITGGRLAGKTDIKPQWRYEAMTRLFGVCGFGWWYDITRIWTEPAPEGQVVLFAQVAVYIKQGDSISQPIVGVGGSMLIEKERGGLYVNDEAVKMAVTDALSVALKMLGVGADIYMGKHESKYHPEPKEPQIKTKEATTQEIEAVANALIEAKTLDELKHAWETQFKPLRPKLTERQTEYLTNIKNKAKEKLGGQK